MVLQSKLWAELARARYTCRKCLHGERSKIAGHPAAGERRMFAGDRRTFSASPAFDPAGGALSASAPHREDNGRRYCCRGRYLAALAPPQLPMLHRTFPAWLSSEAPFDNHQGRPATGRAFRQPRSRAPWAHAFRQVRNCLSRMLRRNPVHHVSESSASFSGPLNRSSLDADTTALPCHQRVLCGSLRP